MIMRKNFRVFDWAGNLMFNGMVFDDFEDAWGYIMEKFPDEEDWQEFHVSDSGSRESRYLEPHDNRANRKEK